MACGAHAPVAVTSAFGGRPKGAPALVEEDDSAVFRCALREFCPAKDDGSSATAEDGIVDKGYVGGINVDGWEHAPIRSPLGVRAIICDLGTKWKEVLYLQGGCNKIPGHTRSYEKVLRALSSKIMRGG